MRLCPMDYTQYAEVPGFILTMEKSTFSMFELFSCQIHDFQSSLAVAPDCCRFLSLPNKQSGKYNKMDPILIGTAVSDHVIRERSKPAVQMVKAL